MTYEEQLLSQRGPNGQPYFTQLIDRDIVADYIEKGAAYLEEHGLTRGRMIDHHTGQVCMLGAVREAIHAEGPDQYAMQSRQTIRMMHDHAPRFVRDVGGIPSFSDNFAKDEGQAANMLRIIAARVREGNRE